MDNWYNKFGSEIKPKKTLQVLGKYYYEFSDDIIANYENGIQACYSNNNKYDVYPSSDIYIGRDFRNVKNTFGGKVYAVRVYNTCLKSDSIKTNYNVDQAKYVINNN